MKTLKTAAIVAALLALGACAETKLALEGNRALLSNTQPVGPFALGERTVEKEFGCEGDPVRCEPTGIFHLAFAALVDEQTAYDAVVAAQNEAIIIASLRRIGDEKRLPDGSRAYYADIENQLVRKAGMDFQVRVVVQCRNSVCASHMPDTDEVSVNWVRTAIFVAIISGVVIHAVTSGGSSSPVATITGGGGGGGGGPPGGGI